jgi:rhodanese-related sulfurtransferase
LLIGQGARVDLPGGDPSALWDTLSRLAQVLPSSGADTVLFPAFDSNDLLFTTFAVERDRNPDLIIADRAAFLAAKSGERGRGDAEARRRLQYNALSHPVETHESHFGNASPGQDSIGGGMASISVEKYALKVREHASGICFLDVREPNEFAAGHIPGAINIPLAELATRLDTLKNCKRIYVSCQTGRRSHPAARTLDYLGLPDVVNVSGGFKAWQSCELPIETG